MPDKNDYAVKGAIVQKRPVSEVTPDGEGVENLTARIPAKVDIYAKDWLLAAIWAIVAGVELQNLP